MKTITSRSNELIKHVSSLTHKKYRDLHQEYIAEGVRTCITLIEHSAHLLHLFVTLDHKDSVPSSVADNNIVIVPDSVMLKLSSSAQPSGMIGQFKKPPTPSLDRLGAGIVLACVGDPGNVGTLIRTTAALGYKTVVCIDGADPYSPKAIQASAGTVGMVHIFECSWKELVDHKKSIALTALVISGGKKPQEIVQKNLLIVIGSEAHGIPHEWLSDCDQLLTLPMPGGTESLNAAIAGSIALYQTLLS